MDVISMVVIAVDLCTVAFLLWRVTAKTATLSWNAKVIYSWIALTSTYHTVIYTVSLFKGNPDAFIQAWLHPVVPLFLLSPLLVAIIHWRGGDI